MSATLRAGDMNYLTAVAPGDFVFVNVVNWAESIGQTTPEDDKANTKPKKIAEMNLYERAKSFAPINGLSDGFKGLFKIQSVRRALSVNPASGAKEVVFHVDGYGFTEFNNVVYFNQHLIPPGSDKNIGLFVTNLSTFWHSLFTTGGLPGVQDVVKFFIKLFIGEGVPPVLKTATGVSSTGANGEKTQENLNSAAEFSQNTQFFVPSGVGKLLGQRDAKAAKDLYVYLMGIQTYNISQNAADNAQTSVMGFVPKVNKPIDGRFFYTGKPCQGQAFMKPDFWNQVPVWNILQEYLNSPINEMYVAYRPSPTGNVMPTLVMRQIPFTSERYKAGEATRFLNLPRWRVSPELILDFNIGRDEAARLNFVQVFGAMGGSRNPSLTITYQIAQGNFVSDKDDIQRSGLRPYVITSNFDQPAPSATGNSAQFTRALEWKELLGDALIGGHLKLNGTIVCAGIQEPIAPGDNFELGDTVYHIESVSHTASVSPGGQRIFRTTLELSNGIDKRSNAQKQRYSQMTNSKMEVELEEDSNTGDGMLPGIADSETVYKDPFFDKEAKKHNKSFDLPPKTEAKLKRPGKLSKKPKRPAK
jgi:hypothetical protein